ncbi:unnamed protein product [Ambrosiozyma monospora]|uniref:Unnamed protein product n=1 Tax=Ambrosiozyma monospora TaxID=43982 RepID=A0ACB5TM31_AMBMO|nr:unnamed protein product [Ambrosiozyma monospora]
MCSFRQRALYDKKQCLVCRTENETMIFTENVGIENYTDLDPNSIIHVDEKYNIGFTSEMAKDVTMSLLDYVCPLADCSDETVFGNFKKLNEHVRESHNLIYCSLCANFKKAFISELKLYNPRQLQTHQSKGDEEGFKGHPLCKFCTGRRFYSDDELFVHMREKHEKCHVCDQIDASDPQYFKNYNHLFEHFTDAHFICTVQSCLDQKFIVFRDEIDLQAHMIKEHGNIFGGRAILASSGGFGSQLSTFNNSRNNNKSKKREDDGNNHDSFEVKKMRLEERARHYLHYSQSGFNEFQEINDSYCTNKLTAEELREAYTELFKQNKTVDVDLNVLIYEFAQLFPNGTPRNTALLELIEEEEKQKQLESQFPALQSSGDRNIITGSWAANQQSVSKSNSRSTTSLTANMPPLPAASAPLFRSSSSTSTVNSSVSRSNKASVPKTRAS